MNTSCSRICLNRFAGADEGNVAIAFGLAAIPAFIIIGAAIDMSRAHNTQTRMQNVLDAATLAAANEYAATGSKAGAEAKLAAYVDAGLAQYGMSRATANTGTTTAGGGTTTTTTGGTTANGGSGTVSGTTSTNVTGGQIGQVTLSNAEFNETTKSVNPSMSVQVGTTLLGLAGVTSIGSSVSSSGSTSSSGQKVEVSMMIDLTGSMGWTIAGESTTKIANLKLAAADFLDILMPASGDAKARVAIAPFADYVNAGPYAVAATGLPSSGSYTNRANLASTKQGSWTGNYTGYYGTTAAAQPAGSQYGTTAATTTYNNAYCANPTQSLTPPMNKDGKTGEKGTSSSSGVAGAVKAGDRGFQGYFRKKWEDGQWKYEWEDGNGKWYIPEGTTTVVAGCETDAVTGPLITCVTERDDTTHRYDDESPATGGGVGGYNAGVTSKSNYSSDGKCFVAGRELPKVIPLTTDRATLNTFFTNATVGGATPGHLGTAWAWYLLSPNWNSVWPADSQAQAYGGARKVAVLMTDGEYNVHYTSPAAKQQALELCANMKAKGVEIYTVGFGFGAGVTSNETGTANERARWLLETCSSGNNHYYFPYDGTKLREAFQAIGNAIVAGQVNAQVRVSQ